MLFTFHFFFLALLIVAQVGFCQAQVSIPCLITDPVYNDVAISNRSALYATQFQSCVVAVLRCTAQTQAIILQIKRVINSTGCTTQKIADYARLILFIGYPSDCTAYAVR